MASESVLRFSRGRIQERSTIPRVHQRSKQRERRQRRGQDSEPGMPGTDLRGQGDLCHGGQRSEKRSENRRRKRSVGKCLRPSVSG